MPKRLRRPFISARETVVLPTCCRTAATKSGRVIVSAAVLSSALSRRSASVRSAGLGGCSNSGVCIREGSSGLLLDFLRTHPRPCSQRPLPPHSLHLLRRRKRNAEAAAAAVLAIAALPPVLAEVAAAAVLVYVLVGWVFGDYVKTRDAARPDML